MTDEPVAEQGRDADAIVDALRRGDVRRLELWTAWAQRRAPHPSAPRVVPLEEFITTKETGAGAILGEPGNVLVPEGGDVMLYGDGGAGKTTLSFDLACHLAAGADWLGIRVPRPVRVLLIENEGPRPLLREKLARKVKAWQGPPLGGRISVLENPWGEFTFASEQWRETLAAVVGECEIDLVLAGPLTRIGMNTAGTLQEVNAFLKSVAEVRTACARRVTIGLVHHENKGGEVSGAWEGAGDTLLHVQAAGNGHTVVRVQKARWASSLHGRTLKLAWTEGEGFELESGGERRPVEEIEALLRLVPWKTAKEIAAPTSSGGVGLNVDTVRQVLADHPGKFESRRGPAAKALGRHPSATVWRLTQKPRSTESTHGSVGGAEEEVTPDSACMESGAPEAPPQLRLRADSAPESHPFDRCRPPDAGGGGQ